MNNHMTTDNEDCSEFGKEAEHVHRKIDLCTRKYKRLSERRALYLCFSLAFNLLLCACVYFGDRKFTITTDVIVVSLWACIASILFFAGCFVLVRFLVKRGWL